MIDTQEPPYVMPIEKWERMKQEQKNQNPQPK